MKIENTFLQQLDGLNLKGEEKKKIEIFKHHIAIPLFKVQTSTDLEEQIYGIKRAISQLNLREASLTKLNQVVDKWHIDLHLFHNPSPFVHYPVTLAQKKEFLDLCIRSGFDQKWQGIISTAIEDLFTKEVAYLQKSPTPSKMKSHHSSSWLRSCARAIQSVIKNLITVASKVQKIGSFLLNSGASLFLNNRFHSFPPRATPKEGTQESKSDPVDLANESPATEHSIPDSHLKETSKELK